MTIQNAQQDVNGSHTSDGEPRSNLMTRDEFLRRVLYSGEVTRISQHLAVVIFLVAEGRNQLNISVRDLERITGWSRTAIKDHLTELEVFMKVTFGGGRAKALFELQGVIEDALATAVVAGSRPPRVATNVMAAQPATSVVASRVATSGVVASDAAANVVASQAAIRSVMASQPAANGLVASHVAASLLASVAATSPVMASQATTNSPSPPVVASQVATNSSSTERERESNNSNLSLSSATPREEADPIQLNGVAIYGPDFKLSYASIDEAAFLIGMPRDRARAIATIHARDWAMNGKRPDYPMAMIRKLLKNDINEGQVQEIKIEKARAEAAPKESRAARLMRQVESAAEKGGKP
jgi:hypothetical protein